MINLHLLTHENGDPRDALWTLSDRVSDPDLEIEEREGLVSSVLRDLFGISIWDLINRDWAEAKWSQNHSNMFMWSSACNYLVSVWERHRDVTSQMERNPDVDFFQCEFCGQITHSIDTLEYEGKPFTVCMHCAQSTASCDECGKVVFAGSYIWLSGKVVCTPCSEKYEIAICQCCNHHFLMDELSEYTNLAGFARLQCVKCARRRVYTCTGCGDKIHEIFDSIHWTEDDEVYCSECYQVQRPVMQYDFYDNDPNMLKMDYEKQNPDTLFFGIEFEIEADWMGDMARYTEQQLGTAAQPCIPEGWGYIKHDGTLRHGIEVVTNPMTPLFYKKNRSMFNKMLNDLALQGWRTDQFDEENRRLNCGLHVHMSKAAFTTGHLYKFVRFFYKVHMRKLVQAISERKANEFCEFMRNDFREPVRMAKDKRNVSGKRHSVINMCGGHYHERRLEEAPKTVEFRLFQGSIDPEIVHKNIEFLLSVYRFTRDTSITHITQKNYFRFLKETPNQWRHLIKFLTDKLERKL